MDCTMHKYKDESEWESSIDSISDNKGIVACLVMEDACRDAVSGTS